MAKKGPRSYPNTFWMILGTSKILTFFGPIIGHFWARRPCICGLSYTKLPQQILESMWGHFRKYYVSMSDNQNVRKFSKGKPSLFLNLFFVYIYIYIFFVSIF